MSKHIGLLYRYGRDWEKETTFVGTGTIEIRRQRPLVSVQARH